MKTNKTDEKEYVKIRDNVRNKLWDWMVQCNGNNWLYYRRECMNKLKKSILIMKSKNPDKKVNYYDIPNELRLEAINLMIYKEDVEKLLR